MSLDAEPRPMARLGRWGLVGLRLLVSALLCLWAFGRADWHGIGQVFARADVGSLAASYLLWLGCAVLGAWRWHLLVRHRRRAEVPFAAILQDHFLGAMAGLVLPTQVGGDAARIGALVRRGVGAADAGASVFMDRLLGAAGLLGFCLVGLLGGTRPSIRAATLAGSAAVAGAMGVCLTALLVRPVGLAMRRLLGRPRLQRPVELLSEAYRTAHGYLLAPGLMAATLALTLAFHALTIIANLAAAQALGIALTPAAAFILLPQILLLTMVAPTINGIGARENLFLWGLSVVGVAADSALALSTVNLFATFVIALPGCVGLLRLGLEGLRAPASPPAAARPDGIDPQGHDRPGWTSPGTRGGGRPCS